MPLIPVLAALLLVLLFVLAAPFLLIVRYRVGIARRPARRWVATINLLSLLGSTALFVWAAAMTNFWVPHVFRYSLVGLISGVLLGMLGLILTRWEPAPRALYYQPNRWLVLLITFAVASRMLYGLWRIWHAWRTTGHDSSWLTAAGIPGSMAVGALVLGYYLTYFAGVRFCLGLFAPSDHTRRMKPLLTLLILLGFYCHSSAAIPLAQGRRIQELNVISTRTLQRSISPRFYRSLCVSPIEGWVVIRGCLVDTHLSATRIIHSELDGSFDQLALKLAKEQVIAGYYGIERPGRVGSVLLHLLVYQIADGTMVLFFPTFDEPGGDQIRTWGCAKLLVLKKNGTWDEIEGPEGLQGKGWAVRMANRGLSITGSPK